MWRKFSDIRPLDVTGAVSWNYQNLNGGNHHQTGWDIKVSVQTWKEGINNATSTKRAMDGQSCDWNGLQ